jgi:transposase-like protein
MLGTEKRSGQRNGHKPRTLRTRVGTLDLLVPQDREGTFSTRLFSRYQRNEQALVLALMEIRSTERSRGPINRMTIHHSKQESPNLRESLHPAVPEAA